jgi:hypothetical protein
MSFSVSGANNINKRLQLSALGGVALRNFFSQYGQVVVTNSKKEAPRYKGNLRGSLTFKRIDGVGRLPIGIDVYSRSPYALYVHGFYDMKVKMRKPWSRSKPHYPPISAIKGWADDKDISPYAVQHAIGQRGTPLIPFFKIGIKKSEAEKKVLLKGTGLKITATWKAGRMAPKK